MIRTLDAEKCIGCGTCQKTCPLDVFRVEPVPGCGTACAAACPLHQDIREVQRLVQLGEVEAAAALLWENNPLGAVTGRVCPHFCESECARGKVDSAVNISGIERFLGDLALAAPVCRSTGGHVATAAVVGAGPAGLACAAELTRLGFTVHVYEAQNEPGGMLRYGIPEYRLPPGILAALMDKLRAQGTSFHCGQRLGHDFTLESLKDAGHGAVFVALGASQAKRVAVDGLDGPGIDFGLDFLKKVRTRAVRSAGGRVAVVGGGDVAMDVAQSLVRLGAGQVSVFSLEAETAMPAFRHNKEDALHLGVHMEPSTAVQRILRDAQGAVCGIELARCTRVFDEQGRFAPQIDTSRTWQVDVEQVVFAVGQTCDLSGLPEILRARNLVPAHEASGQTALPFVFAGGDMTTGPSSVASAIGAGLRAARAMHLYMRGGDVETITPWQLPVPPAPAEPGKLRPQKRQEGTCIPVGPHTRGFAEPYQGLELDQALAEGNRCLTCGSKAVIAHPDDCMTCFTCELYCPTGSLYVHPIKEAWPRALAPLPKAR